MHEDFIQIRFCDCNVCKSNLSQKLYQFFHITLIKERNRAPFNFEIPYFRSSVDAFMAACLFSLLSELFKKKRGIRKRQLDASCIGSGKIRDISTGDKSALPDDCGPAAVSLHFRQNVGRQKNSGASGAALFQNFKKFFLNQRIEPACRFIKYIELWTVLERAHNGYFFPVAQRELICLLPGIKLEPFTESAAFLPAVFSS